MDNRAIFKMDMGFYIGTHAMGPSNVLIQDPGPLGLYTRNLDHNSFRVGFLTRLL